MPKTIKDKVYSFKTKYEQGFTSEEEKEILKEFPNINMDKYNNAMMGNTCMMIDKKIITYHCDMVTAIRCGVENRDQYSWEWD